MGVVVTGNIFMAVCTAFGIMFSPLVFTTIVITLCDMNYKFMSYDAMDIVMDMWRWTIPVFPLLKPLIGVGSTMIGEFIPGVILWILPTTVSYLCFMKRSLENAGQPVAVPIFRPIIKVLGVLGASSLGGMLFGYSSPFMFYVGALVIGIIFHMVFEVLFAGDVRVTFNNLLHFLFIYAVVALVFTVTYLDLTGFDERIEPVQDIESIIYNGDIEISDEASVAIIHGWMSDEIARYKSQVEPSVEVIPESQIRNIHQELTINLKDGTSYNRSYYFYNIGEEGISAIETSEEYIEQRFTYNLTDTDKEEIKVAGKDTQEMSNWSTPHADLNYASGELTGEEFINIYDMLEAKKDLLTPEYIRNNTPVLSIWIYNRIDNRDIRLYVFDINEDVLEYLGMPLVQLNNSVGFEVGSKYRDELIEIMKEQDIDFSEEDFETVINYDLDDAELFTQLEEVMTPILGHVSLNGNYNQYDKPIVLITVKGSTVGYITLEELRELKNNK